MTSKNYETLEVYPLVGCDAGDVSCNPNNKASQTNER